MIIECPSCRFRRDVPDASIRPGKKYKVTCPRCSSVFHFSLPEEEELPPADRSVESTPPPAREEAPAAPVREEPSAGGKPPVPHLSTEQEGDDPLPPGAQIPEFDKEKPVERKEEKPEEKPARHKPSGFWEHWRSIREHVRAYDEGQEESSSRSDGRPDGAPWESPEYYGFWGSFSRTLLGVLFHAPDFFRHVSAFLRGQQPLFHGILQLLQAVSLPPGRDQPGLRHLGVGTNILQQSLSQCFTNLFIGHRTHTYRVGFLLSALYQIPKRSQYCLCGLMSDPSGWVFLSVYCPTF